MRYVSTLASTILMLAAPLTAQPCPGPCSPLLTPATAGPGGQTLAQGYAALLEALYSDSCPEHATQRALISGVICQVPPWFVGSDACTTGNLETQAPCPLLPSAPSVSGSYFVNGDELSELAIVTAMGASEIRMQEIIATIQAMDSPQYPGLPCWIAVREGATLTCSCTDTASDVTARVGLAYYLAAANPAFSAAFRQTCRQAGDAVARAHLAKEYAATQCLTSPATGLPICHWVGGGANTAGGGTGGLQDMHMWIGYYPDIVKLLLAAYKSTGDSTFRDRASEVVDQFLVANGVTSSALGCGSMQFKWKVSGASISTETVKVWEFSDASRALGMGDALRARQLLDRCDTGFVSGPWLRLSQWVEGLFTGQGVTGIATCVKYASGPSGCVPTGAIQGGFFENGLGCALHTFLHLDTLDDKLLEALSHYPWGETCKGWDWTSCFGIYRPVRPMKAIASAIGLDAAAYAGPPPPIASAPASVCAGTPLALTASEVPGATYSWSGPAGFTSSQRNPVISPATLAAAGTYRVTATLGACTSYDSSVTVAVTTCACPLPPVVTPPAPVTVSQSTCSPSVGATLATLQVASFGDHAALLGFVNGGSATDDCSTPARQPAQLSGADITSTTLFPAGTSTVTFRFADGDGNVGTATSTVTVRRAGDLNQDGLVDLFDLIVLANSIVGNVSCLVP